MTLSKYTWQTSQVSPASARSISFWNNAGALVKPKLSTLNLKVPLLVIKSVLSADPGSIAACQYPDRKSRLLKNFDPPSEFRQVPILGNGYESL